MESVANPPTDSSSAARSGSASTDARPDPERWAVMAGTGDLLALVTGRIQRLRMLDDIAELAVAHELVDALARAARNLKSWGLVPESEEIDDLQAEVSVRLNEVQQEHYKRLREVMDEGRAAILEAESADMFGARGQVTQ